MQKSKKNINNNKKRIEYVDTYSCKIIFLRILLLLGKRNVTENEKKNNNKIQGVSSIEVSIYYYINIVWFILVFSSFNIGSVQYNSSCWPRAIMPPSTKLHVFVKEDCSGIGILFYFLYYYFLEKPRFHRSPIVQQIHTFFLFFFTFFFFFLLSTRSVQTRDRMPMPRGWQLYYNIFFSILFFFFSALSFFLTNSFPSTSKTYVRT